MGESPSSLLITSPEIRGESPSSWGNSGKKFEAGKGSAFSLQCFTGSQRRTDLQWVKIEVGFLGGKEPFGRLSERPRPGSAPFFNLAR